MTMTQVPVITIVHRLPGRMRLRLSRWPADMEKTITMVREHPGILLMQATEVSGSLLVVFNSFQVTAEEIIIRVATSLSLDHGCVPVKVLAEPELRELNESSFYSALAIAAALIARPMGFSQRRTLILDWVAGLGTASAIVAHGYEELRRIGYFHPEVLSVVYLASAFLRDRILSSALVAWVTSFGRHLFRPPARGVLLRVTHAGDKCSADEGYGIVVRPDNTDPTVAELLRAVPSLIQYALLGASRSGGNSLLQDITDVARVHDQVMEGLGQMDRGVPIRFTYD